MAVGGKPYQLLPSECKGYEHAITSDDIFFLKELPKKAVILGGGYIATECASFLSELGTEVYVINRSRPLRKYDLQISQYMTDKFTKAGWKIIDQAKPVEIMKLKNGKLEFSYVTKDYPFANQIIENVDIVLSAISRVPNVDYLGLKNTPSIKLSKDRRLLGGFNKEYDRLSKDIYAIGDCLEGMPELTPIAIKSGRHLASKINSEMSGEPVFDSTVDLTNFPSTVFTWPEYSFCGYSEENAVDKFGKENVICYHSLAELLESSLEDNDRTETYVKIVCFKQPNGNEKVVGLHYVGVNAGQVMQGFAVF